jgi:UDP-glucose 4-epimerase
MMIVTGCAGFIGSNFVDRLLRLGNNVIGIDNLSTGKLRFIEKAIANPNFRFVQADLMDLPLVKSALNGASIVFHFAANADVRFGPNHPKKDLEQNTVVTFNILEAMRVNRISQLVFSSTGSVYGEAKIIPTPEDAPFPIQTSLYGASKLACEGLISAYCESFGIRSLVFRFVSILGERYTHGHLYDFYRQLRINPSTLNVLGNGHQKKSYLYVEDCIDAVLVALDKSKSKFEVFNLGLDEYCEVNKSIEVLCRMMDVDPKIVYSGGDRGWIGDNPMIYLDAKKINLLGWEPKLTIQEAMEKTILFFDNNQWIFNDA